MPEDGCRDCKKRFPGGEGLVDGRCPACLAVYRARQEEPPPEPVEEQKAVEEEQDAVLAA